MQPTTLAQRKREQLAILLEGCHRPELAQAVRREINPSPKRQSQFEAVALECMHGHSPTRRVVSRTLDPLQYRVYEPKLNAKHKLDNARNSVFHAILHAKHIVEHNFPVTRMSELESVTKTLRTHVVDEVERSVKIQNAIVGVAKHADHGNPKYREQFFVPIKTSSRGQFSWRKYALLMQRDAWGDFPEAQAAAHYLNCEVHIYQRGPKGAFVLMESFVPGRRAKRDVLRLLRVGPRNSVPRYFALWDAILANYQTGPSQGKLNFLNSSHGQGRAIAINAPGSMRRVMGNAMSRTKPGPLNDLNDNNNKNFSGKGWGAPSTPKRTVNGRASTRSGSGSFSSQNTSGRASARASGRANNNNNNQNENGY